MLSGQSFQSASNNAAAHEHTVAFFHGLQVAITMTVMTSIVQYAYWTVLSKRRNVEGHWNKFKPVYITMLATVLVTVQPMLILIIGSWHAGIDCTGDLAATWPCTNVFWTADATNSFFPNQISGWLIQILCTYLGYVLLIVGVFQATDMTAKLSHTWRAARGVV
mmetsp:Transcript_137462/g.293768  ORF Transcript_137462/g.293768 Transcript_137462/m.293768 type:complete len:164 (-) Transcript_137462:211-702(-)